MVLDLSLLDSRNRLWICLSKLIGSNKDDIYRVKYPLNPIYTPVEHSYYWTKCFRLLKGKNTKGGE